MNQVAKNPGCQRECRLAPPAGFVIEVGCSVHDRPGYRPFEVFWFAGHPCLIGTLALSNGVGTAHEHVVCASFLMGLN